MSRRICVVTGTRADFGLLRGVMRGIQAAAGLELQVIATGMHLSPEFGLTWQEIEAAGIAIDYRVETLLSSDTAVGVTKATGLGLIGFADALAVLKPDMVLLLGDRYEIFAAATAALLARIPIAHVHGGETTEGAFDEAIRHAITKMAYVHFVAAVPYRQRVIQLGEDPARVYLSGGLGVDALLHLRLLARAELEASLDFRLGEKNLLITFHPATLEPGAAEAQMAALLQALDALQHTRLIFTLPNADHEGRALIRQIEQFVASRPHARAYTSLGQLRYLSLLAQVDAVVGNSSSGLTEAPSLKTATVNIGLRQQGRLLADSVIQCDSTQSAITAALQHVYDPAFRSRLAHTLNPYGNGGASALIVETLQRITLGAECLRKHFHDLPYPTET